jgi:hypothetical protein
MLADFNLLVVVVFVADLLAPFGRNARYLRAHFC